MKGTHTRKPSVSGLKGVNFVNRNMVKRNPLSVAVQKVINRLCEERSDEAIPRNQTECKGLSRQEIYMSVPASRHPASFNIFDVGAGDADPALRDAVSYEKI